MNENKITESASPYRHQEKMTAEEIVFNINKEDKSVAFAVEKQLLILLHSQKLLLIN
jgi:N-acetylmuramic acid 6-phosphate etherase